MTLAKETPGHFSCFFLMDPRTFKSCQDSSTRNRSMVRSTSLRLLAAGRLGKAETHTFDGSRRD